MSFLLDASVLWELKKGERADPALSTWLDTADDGALHLSVLALGEVRQAVEGLRRTDKKAARALQLWLETMAASYRERVLPVDVAVVDRWGALNVPEPLPPVDGLVAATALVHGLTLVTRHPENFRRIAVEVLSPFTQAAKNRER